MSPAPTDEKLLRVFGKPKGVAETWSKLCKTRSKNTTGFSDAAHIPVFALSNKAIQAVGDDEPSNNVTIDP